MASYKMPAVRYAGYLPLLALAFCFCSQTPDSCGDGEKLDSRKQFCFDNKAWDKCGGNEYDPYAQFCSAGAVYDKCGGKDGYDPVREFCAVDKILGKCGGSDTYAPDSQGCVFGLVKPRCGNNFYDPVNEFCHNGATVYPKCDGQAFNPEQGCGNAAVKPVCGTENYNAATQSCSNNRVYENGKTNPICNSAEYDASKKFCYMGTLHDLCGGQDYDPSKSTCSGTTVVDNGNVTPPPDSTVQFIVTFNTNGGNPASINPVAVDSGATLGTKYPSGPTKDGYRFVEWRNVEDATGCTAATIIKNDVTLLAIFMQIYEVTVSSIGIGASGSGNYAAGDTVTVKSGTSADGDVFKNWTTNSGVAFIDTNGMTTKFIMPTRAVIVTANFGFTDARDGKIYKTVTIGNKKWMAENLNYGTNNVSVKYGAAYYEQAAKQSCPSGWHLSTRQEWKDLVKTAGDSSVAGKTLKAATDWRNNGGGTDSLGFSALPGGYHTTKGEFYYTSFYEVELTGDWWAEEIGSDGKSTFYIRSMYYDRDDVSETTVVRGASWVRCVKD